MFLAKDVAEWLEMDTNQVGKMILKVDDDEVVKKPRNTNTGLKESWFLTEDGIYEVLMQSRKPIAKQSLKLTLSLYYLNITVVLPLNSKYYKLFLLWLDNLIIKRNSKMRKYKGSRNV